MSVVRYIADATGSLLRGLAAALWAPIQRAAARGDAGKRSWIAMVSIVVIAASLVSLVVRACKRGGPRADSSPFIAVGQVLAEETAKLLGDKGQIVVVTVEPGQFSSVIARGRVEACQRTLRAHPGIRIVAVQSVKPVMPTSPETRLSAEVYSGILREHPDADAIVSFVGVPVLTDKQIQSLPPRIPKCVALDTTGLDLRKLFQNDVVQLVVVSRPGEAAASASGPGTPRQWFDQYFQIVTASTPSSTPR